MVEPTPSYSNITTNTPYLIFFEGQLIIVKVTLNNTDGDASNGPYTVSITVDKR